MGIHPSTQDLLQGHSHTGKQRLCTRRPDHDCRDRTGRRGSFGGSSEECAAAAWHRRHRCRHGEWECGTHGADDVILEARHPRLQAGEEVEEAAPLLTLLGNRHRHRLCRRGERGLHKREIQSLVGRRPRLTLVGEVHVAI